jgi:hypothetical protein
MIAFTVRFLAAGAVLLSCGASRSTTGELHQALQQALPLIGGKGTPAHAL